MPQTILHDPPVHENQCPVARVCERLVMCDKEKSSIMRPMKGAEEGENLLRALGVQVASRLIRQNEGRLADQGPSHRHPLLLTARKLTWASSSTPFESYRPQDPSRLLSVLVVDASPTKRQREHDVFDCGQRRDQVVELENESEFLPPQSREIVVGQIPCAPAPEQHMTRRRAVQETDQIEKRALARARRADQCGELRPADREVDAAEHLLGRSAAFVASSDTFQTKDWFSHAESRQRDPVGPHSVPGRERPRCRSRWRR